jgi:multidrug resistance efflux pump
MDIPRARTRPRLPLSLVVPGALLGAVLLASIGMAAFDRAPSIPRESVFIETVVRGPMVREVRGPGTLIPGRVQFISAVTAGRVDRVHLQRGAELTANSVILELANPDVQIETLEADRQLADAQAALIALRVDLRDRLLAQSSRVEELRVDASDAARKALVIDRLRAEGLGSAHEAQDLQGRAAALARRLDLESERLAIMRSHLDERIAAQEAQTTRMASIARFQHARERSMVVRGGTPGVLQEVLLEAGQYAQAGAVLARVIPTPMRLKAVLRIAETQAADVVPGLSARIDTRHGIVAGHVSRIDPAASGGTVSVDVTLADSLPPGARPDLQIDGAIDIERLGEVVYVTRPVVAQPNTAIDLFKITADGRHAERTPVRVGRMSVNSAEITGGLVPGDRVILSDMSRWSDVDRVRLR